MPDKTQLLDRRLSLSLGWALFAALLLLQYSTFVHRAEREVTWAYPTHFDQTQYLQHSYETFEEMRQHGFLRGFWYGLMMTTYQGKILHLEAATLFLFLGASRTTALTLNFLHFALLQFFVLYTARWLTRRWTAGWLALGLVLATRTRLQDAGGMLDFRLDFMAACLIGIMICLVIRSGVFRYRNWSIAAGLATAMLIAFRFLSTVLVAPVWGGTLAYFAYLAWRRGGHWRWRRLAQARARNLLLAVAVVVAAVTPMLVLSWPAISYYYFGHVTGGEYKLRLAEYGIHSARDFLLYYPRSVASDHLGPHYIIGFLLLAAMALARARWTEHRLLGISRPSRQAYAVFCAIALAGPVLVLMLWPSRSPVVGTLLTFPIVATSFLIIVWLAARFGLRRNSRLIPAAMAGLALLLGATVEFDRSRPSLPASWPSEYRAVTEFYQQIGGYCERAGLTAPKLVFDRIWDFLTPNILSPFYYERQGVLLRPFAPIGIHVVPVSDQAAASALAESDLVVLTAPTSPYLPGAIYPYSESMKQRYTMLRDIADREMVPLRSFHLFSQDLTLYVRPTARIDIRPSEWITSAGAVLRAEAQVLRLRPVLELSGRTSLIEYLGNKLGVHVLVSDGSRTLNEFDLVVNLAPSYVLKVPLRTENLPEHGEVSVRLTFNKSVVPKHVGLNDDTRELVLMAPERLRLLAAGNE